MLAYDQASGSTGSYTVTAVLKHNEQLTIDNEQLETTPEHPFFTQERGWVAAGVLWDGAHVRKADGDYGVVQALEITSKPQVMYNLTVAQAHTFFVGQQRWLVHNKCGFSFDSLRGKSVRWLKRMKPKGWRTVPTDNGEGWKWLDEANNERLRFYRPTGTNPSNYQWSRQVTGYIRWLDENGNYLDIDSNVVPRSDPDFNWKTHIPYEGIYP